VTEMYAPVQRSDEEVAEMQGGRGQGDGSGWISAGLRTCGDGGEGWGCSFTLNNYCSSCASVPSVLRHHKYQKSFASGKSNECAPRIGL
jgi:hypothetical protein